MKGLAEISHFEDQYMVDSLRQLTPGFGLARLLRK